MKTQVILKIANKDFTITDSDGQADLLKEWLLSNTTLTWPEYKLAKQNEEEITCITLTAA